MLHFLNKLPNHFLMWLYCCIFPPLAMHGISSCSASLSEFLFLSILIGVWWYIMILNLYSYRDWWFWITFHVFFLYLHLFFVKFLFNIFAHIVKIRMVVFLWIFESSLYILMSNSLSYIWFPNIFSLSMACLFILLTIRIELLTPNAFSNRVSSCELEIAD